MEEENYEQAVIAFEEAIAIDDRCIEAYEGDLEAYLGAGDMDGAQDFYDRTFTMLSGLDKDFFAENMDYAVQLYVAVEKVYGDDREKIVQVLEEAYAATGEDSGIKDKLIENYIEIGKKETQDGIYEDALTVYDRLLELDNMNMETIRGLCECLNKYIDVLMAAGRYDEIRILAYKYKDIAVNVDFDGILARIAEQERIEADNRAFMQKVYELMAVQDYEGGLMEVYASEEAEAFIEQLGNDNYIYFPDNNDSHIGIGAGLYQFEDIEYGKSYYFYYGGYVNSERKGNGTEFLNSDAGYYLFTGIWDKDAPNGEGIEVIIDGIGEGSTSRYNFAANGMLVDGLWDGQVSAILTDEQTEEKFDVSFSAVKGIPTENKSEECLSVTGWDDEWSKEGEYIMAFDYNPDTKHGWWYAAYEGKSVGITGFGD